MSLIMKFGDALQGLIPQPCLICQRPGRPLEVKRGVDRLVCAHCLSASGLLARVACKQCGLRLGPRLQEFGWTHCRHCRALPQESRLAVVCGDYLPPLNGWTVQLKQNGLPEWVNPLADWLAHSAASQLSKLPDLLACVPSTPKRLSERGCDPPALLARRLSRRLDIPFERNLLVKVRESRRQASLGQRERIRNLSSAFSCTRAIGRGITIGLVDDVITTGSTLQACSEALLSAGAASIVWMAVARTPERPDLPAETTLLPSCDSVHQVVSSPVS